MNEYVEYKSSLCSLQGLLGLGCIHLLNHEELMPYMTKILSKINERLILEDKNSFEENIRLFIEYYETELDKTLKERGADYGDYKEVSKVTFDLFKIIENASGFKNFSDDDKLSFFMVFNKIARCVCGRIKYDSLLDIQGYIELIKGKYKD